LKKSPATPATCYRNFELSPYLLKMKRILVTGGAGFIGSNLVKRLLMQGCHVICIDNFDPFYSRRQKEFNLEICMQSPDFELIEGDVVDPEVLEACGEVDTIVHLAGKAGVRASIQEPGKYLHANVGGTQTLLEFARQRKIGQFVFASSSSVYGMNASIPWNEREMLLPVSPYASSKLSAEMLGHVYSHLFGIRFIALRFFTVYGPGQRPDLAIHKFFNCILGGRPVSVFGDGQTARDYTYVGDTVDGITSAIEFDASRFEIFNIGNNKMITLLSLIRTIEEICGSAAILKYYPDQAGDLPVTYADIGKAGQLLNYHPNTDLFTGLTNFYNWFKKNSCLVGVR
jgi:UDP-glucuronate 4-epimerase